MSRPVPPIDGGIDGTTWDPRTLARHIDWFVTLEILEPARLVRVMQAHTQKKYGHLEGLRSVQTRSRCASEVKMTVLVDLKGQTLKPTTCGGCQGSSSDNSIRAKREAEPEPPEEISER
ncbi:MAG: hypothetical protein ACRDYA_23245 [Egibacteraceae bacterium]